MSEADKMFEELGYKKVIDNEKQLQYEYEDKDFPTEDIEISFDKTFLSIKISYRNGNCYDITMQELQAIYKKCEELGWIE